MHRFKYEMMLVACCLAHVILLTISARVNSVTNNEPAHLVAGLSNLEFGRYELYSVNPPLTRLIAAIPVAFAEYRLDWDLLAFEYDTRPVHVFGPRFVDANSVCFSDLLFHARLACIPFGVLGVIGIYYLTQELAGHPAPILAAFLWVTSPNLLTYGCLITPDMAATSFGVILMWRFLVWLKYDSISNAILLGVVLGLALLAKSIWLVSFIVLPLLWLVWFFAMDNRVANGLLFLSGASKLALSLILSVIVLNAGYSFNRTLVPLGKYDFISESLAGKHGVNVFAGTPLARLHLPFPESYVKGLDIQMDDFENFGQPSFCGGRWSENGFGHYYAYGLLVKLPHGTQILILMSLTCVRKWPRELFFIAVPYVGIFVVASVQTGINHHFRYVLPCFPLLLIIASTGYICPVNRSSNKLLWRVTVLLVALFSSFSSLAVFPRNHAYFNELSGGPQNGHHHMLHSAIHWGQDVNLANQWALENLPHGNRMPFLSSYVRFDVSRLYDGLETLRGFAPSEDVIMSWTDFHLLESKEATKGLAVVDRIAHSLVVVRLDRNGAQ